MKTRIGVADVRSVLDAVVAEQPDHRDRRPAGDLPPRYVDDGKPGCLVAVLMHQLGVSVGMLRALDREAGRYGAGVQLLHTRLQVRRKFTPDAWALLTFLQRQNDSAATWAGARTAAFKADPYWLHANPKFAYPGPWCTPENAIAEDADR